jgi:hypothetical protein
MVSETGMSCHHTDDVMCSIQTELSAHNHLLQVMTTHPCLVEDAPMPTRKTSPTSTATARVAPDPVDEMMNRYVSWREAAGAASEAYADWRAAPRIEEAWRFTTYLAALDAEETSADNYALAVADVASSLERALRV